MAKQTKSISSKSHFQSSPCQSSTPKLSILSSSDAPHIHITQSQPRPLQFSLTFNHNFSGVFSQISTTWFRISIHKPEKMLKSVSFFILIFFTSMCCPEPCWKPGSALGRHLSSSWRPVGTISKFNSSFERITSNKHNTNDSFLK